MCKGIFKTNNFIVCVLFDSKYFNTYLDSYIASNHAGTIHFEMDIATKLVNKLEVGRIGYPSF